VARSKREAGPSRTADGGDAAYGWTLLLAVALLALAVRLVHAWQISQAPFADLRLGDARAYHQWALAILGGDWMGREAFYQAPLYPYFLAVVHGLVGDGTAMVRFVQAVVGSASCVLLAAAGMTMFGRAGVVAGVLLAIYPPAIFFDGLFDKSSLVGFFSTLLLFFLAGPRVRYRAALTGLTLGLLTLTRENALLLAAPVLAWFLIGERAPRAAALFVAGCLVALLPVGVRNYAVGGQFLLTTSQFGPNFYIGNHPGAQGVYEGLVAGHSDAATERDDAARLAEEALGRTLTPAEVSGYWRARAFDFIRSRPLEWLAQLVRKLALTYNAAEIADTEAQEVHAEWSWVLRALAPFGFGVVAVLAACGAVVGAAAARRWWFVHAIVLTYTASVVIFYVFARYRYPLVPALLLLGAGGVAAWREASTRMRGWALGAALLVGMAVYTPLYDTTSDRLTHYVNVGNVLLEEPGRWDQAEHFYNRAIAEAPRLAAAHVGLGTLMALRNRHAEAVRHFQTALDGWPDNTDLRLNLAAALGEAGDDPASLAQFDAVALLRPRDPTPHLLAGQLLIDRHRLEEARTRYQRALELDPDSAAARSGLDRANQRLDGAR
jgi:tetratricopeptide (TPR) repeat protein